MMAIERKIAVNVAVCILIIGCGCYGNPAARGGESLSCYSCHMSGLGDTCEHTQTCAHSQGSCITDISFTENGTWVTRACASMAICAEAQDKNADECNWNDPASFGYEGKCSFCCTEPNCNRLLPPYFPVVISEEDDPSKQDTSSSSGGRSSSGSSNGGGKGCHSHDNQPCCQEYGARSVDVEIKVHVGSGDVNTQQTNSGRQMDNNSGQAILSVTKTTDKATDKPTTLSRTTPVATTTPTTTSTASTTVTTPQPITATKSNIVTTVKPTTTTTKATTTSLSTPVPTTPTPSKQTTSTAPSTTTTTTTTSTTTKPPPTTSTTTAPSTTTATTTTTTTTQPTTTTATTPSPTTTSTTTPSPTTTSTTTPSPTTTTPPTATTTLTTTIPTTTTHEPYYCYVCSDPLCGTQTQKLCNRDAEFCLSTVDQLQDGTRIISKGCFSENVYMSAVPWMLCIHVFLLFYVLRFIIR